MIKKLDTYIMGLFYYYIQIFKEALLLCTSLKSISKCDCIWLFEYFTYSVYWGLLNEKCEAYI